MSVSPSQIRFLIEAGALIGAGFFCTKKAGTHKPSLICQRLQTPCNDLTNLHNSIKIKKANKTRLEATKQTKSKNTLKHGKPYNHVQTITQYL